MNTVIDEMISRATKTLKHAYAPYSNYKVACCITAENNKHYEGVNIENAAYPLSICAEASAIGKMIADGQKQIKSIVILNHKGTICPPCGGCRQRIYEFSTKDTEVYLCDHERVIKHLFIQDLLPHAFELKT